MTSAIPKYEDLIDEKERLSKEMSSTLKKKYIRSEYGTSTYHVIGNRAPYTDAQLINYCAKWQYNWGGRVSTLEPGKHKVVVFINL